MADGPRDVRLLVTATSVSATGTVLTLLAVPWLVLERTGSPSEAGLLAACTGAGLVAGSLLSAPLVQRWGARRASIMADVTCAGATGGLVLVLEVRGYVPVVLGLLLLLRGLASGPANSTKQVLVAELTGLSQERTASATSWLEAGQRTARLVGAPVGGLLLVVDGAQSLFGIDALSFLAAALGVAAMTRCASVVPSPRRLGDGLRYVARDRLTRSVLGTVLITNALEAAWLSVALPVWIRTHQLGSEAYGVVYATVAGSAIVGSLLVQSLAARMPLMVILEAGLLVSGVCKYLGLLSGSLVVLVPLVVAGGFATGVNNPVFLTIQIGRLPGDLRAHVFGAITAVAFATIPLGAALGGLLVAGLPTGVLVTGAVAAQCVSVGALRLNERRLPPDDLGRPSVSAGLP